MFNPVFLQARDDTYGSYVNLCKINFRTVQFMYSIYVFFFFLKKKKRIVTPSVLQYLRTIACALLVVSLRPSS